MAQARCNSKKEYNHLLNTGSFRSGARSILLTSKGIKNQAGRREHPKDQVDSSQRGRREGIFVLPPAIIGKHGLRTPEQGMLAGMCSLFACFVPNCCGQDTSGHEFGVGGGQYLLEGSFRMQLAKDG